MQAGAWTERVVIGFFVLDRSGEIFLTAAAFAVRAAPVIVVAPIAGALADQVPRARLFGYMAAYRTLLTIGLAIVVTSGSDALWAAFALTAMSGVGVALDAPTTQGPVTDSVPRSLRMNAVATQAIGKQCVGALGGLVSGLVIDRYRASAALLVVVGAYALAGLASLILPTVARAIAKRPRTQWLELPGRSYADLRALMRLATVRGCSSPPSTSRSSGSPSIRSCPRSPATSSRRKAPAWVRSR
jgi:MFS family permease